MKIMFWLDRVGRTQLVVHRVPPHGMSSVRSFAVDHGFVVVDARWRRWDKWAMWSNVVVFALGGGPWFCLLMALWCGWDWARSFPRRDES